MAVIVVMMLKWLHKEAVVCLVGCERGADNYG